MDERQCRRVAIAVARLAAGAQEAKAGLPRAPGESAEASRRPRQRCRRLGNSQRGGLVRAFGNGAFSVGTEGCHPRVTVSRGRIWHDGNRWGGRWVEKEVLEP